MTSNLAAFDTPKNLAAANNSLNSKRTLNAQLTKCTYNGSVAAPEVHGSGGKFYQLKFFNAPSKYLLSQPTKQLLN